MAIEEMFVASAITSSAFIAALLYLHHKTGSEFWKTVWLIGVFAVIDYSLAIMDFGFRRVVVINDFDNLTTPFLTIAMWSAILLSLYLVFVLFVMIVKAVLAMISGRSAYGKTEEHDPDFS